MNKSLIICGPTATGKTSFGLEIAKQFSGEIISADSRQVYIGMDVITGKDIPPGFHQVTSDIMWHGQPLSYYTDGQTRIWLTAVVDPSDQFNVSFWQECALLVLNDIHQRHKLPIVIGVTGLYIKSLIQDMPNIRVSPDAKLRHKLSSQSVDYLFNYLNTLNHATAHSLNESDRQNPRRLIR